MDFSIFSFPFEQIGRGLRQLSLSGAVGNIVAIIMYVIVSLIPCGIFLWLKKKGKICKADIMLFLLSAGLFFGIYYMINPGLFITTGIPGGEEVLGCTIYSLIACYLVVRILAKSAKADTEVLQKGLRIVLYLVMFLLGSAVVIEFVFDLPADIKVLKEADTAMADSMLWGGLAITYVFTVLQSIVSTLPYILDILILFVAAKALKELLEDAYSDAAVTAVQKVAETCSRVLAIVVISGMSFNILQVLFRNSLYRMNITATIPLLSILFVLIVLVAARYVRENQKLKQDNDLII